MIKRLIYRYGRIFCLSSVLLGGLALNGCVFESHGGHGWHHHDHWDRW